MRSIGKVPERGRLSARLLQRGQAFLPGANDLREDLLQLAWEHDVANLDGEELQAERGRPRRDDVLKLRANALTLREYIVNGGASDDLAQRELQLGLPLDAPRRGDRS